MKFAWLEEMAKEGQVRPEALEKIYEDCGRTLEKTALFEEHLGEFGGFAANVLLGGGGMIGLGLAASAAANAVSEQRDDAKTKALVDSVRAKVISDQAIPSADKEKARARFNEILKYAPGLGPNEAVMRQLVLSKYRTGLTNQDVQNLINIQVKMTPSPLGYAAASKHASQKSSVQEVCGEKLAEAYLRLEKTAAFKDYMIDLLKVLSVPVGAAVGVGAVGAIGSGISSHMLNRKIERSREQVFSGPKDSIIGENRAKAEQAFSTLSNFAPHIAADPHAARAFVTKLVSYSPDKDSPLGIQSSDLRELTDIERNMGGSKGLFENLNTALGTSGFGGAVGRGALVASDWDKR